jgi:hypothetical protein
MMPRTVRVGTDCDDKSDDPADNRVTSASASDELKSAHKLPTPEVNVLTTFPKAAKRDPSDVYLTSLLADPLADRVIPWL